MSEETPSEPADEDKKRVFNKIATKIDNYMEKDTIQPYTSFINEGGLIKNHLVKHGRATSFGE